MFAAFTAAAKLAVASQLILSNWPNASSVKSACASPAACTTRSTSCRIGSHSILSRKSGMNLTSTEGANDTFTTNGYSNHIARANRGSDQCLPNKTTRPCNEYPLGGFLCHAKCPQLDIAEFELSSRASKMAFRPKPCNFRIKKIRDRVTADNLACRFRNTTVIRNIHKFNHPLRKSESLIKFRGSSFDTRYHIKCASG